jgi:hypothetical protein
LFSLKALFSKEGFFFFVGLPQKNTRSPQKTAQMNFCDRLILSKNMFLNGDLEL